MHSPFPTPSPSESNGHDRSVASQDAQHTATTPIRTPDIPETALLPTSLIGRDLIPRLRDTPGNRQGWTYASRTPRTDQTTLENTPLMGVIEGIRAKLPLHAGILHHYFDHVLLNMIGMGNKTRQEEEVMRQAGNHRAIQHNAPIEAAITTQEEQRDEAAQSGREALAAIGQELHEAHLEAGQLVSAVGGSYDSEEPDETCAVRVTRRPLEEIAAALQLGWIPGDAAVRLTSGIAWALTMGMGLLIGISLGVATNFVQPDTIGRQPLVALAAAVIGVVIATLGRYAVKPIFYLASERHALGRPWTSWVPLLGVALSLGIFIIILDALVERQGLLRFVLLNQATLTIRAQHAHRSGGPASDPVYLLIGVVMTFPYVACAALDGFLAGRYHAIENRLRLEQTREFEARDQERRSDPAVQAALAQIAKVKAILHRQEALRHETEVSIASFEAKIAERNACLLPLQHDLDERAYQRIQDAQDDAEYAQTWWNGMLEAAVSSVEPGLADEDAPRPHLDSKQPQKGFWQRLFGK